MCLVYKNMLYKNRFLQKWWKVSSDCDYNWLLKSLTAVNCMCRYRPHPRVACSLKRWLHNWMLYLSFKTTFLELCGAVSSAAAWDAGILSHSAWDQVAPPLQMQIRALVPGGRGLVLESQQPCERLRWHSWLWPGLALAVSQFAFYLS